jgi:hypothetical protein
MFQLGRSETGEIFYGEWSPREQKLVEQAGGRYYFCNQLFYVSRAIPEDARSEFYSGNHMWFCDERRFGFGQLLELTPLAWRSLRNITICFGRKNYRFWDYPSGCYKEYRLLAQDIGDIDAQRELSDDLAIWRLICSKLATYSTQNDQLELQLICDAATKDAAAQFIAPLHDLPRLKGLSISLGGARRLDLQYMILSTIRQKTQYFPQLADEPFPFLALPAELQFRVLEYLELVVLEEALTSRSTHQSFGPSMCWRYSCDASRNEDFTWGGYCPSISNSVSTIHTCWNIPHALFLVSRAVRELALSVYYSRNIIRPWYRPSKLPAPVRVPWSPDRSEFLSHVPQHSWHSIRHIHWVFPAMEHDAFYPDSGEIHDWINTLSNLFMAVRPCMITMEFSFARPKWSGVWPEDPINISREWKLYGRIVEPLARWRDMSDDLLIHSYCQRLSAPDDSPTERSRRSNERKLEQKFMGADYDSLARGKVYDRMMSV